MAQVELRMPKMGESIIEATIINWLKNPGDTVEADETILEIATDKVDSEIPAPVSGVLSEIRFPKDTVVAVGEVIALIATDGETATSVSDQVSDMTATETTPVTTKDIPVKQSESPPPKPVDPVESKSLRPTRSDRFYSPLVRNIAQQEGITIQELDSITGTGLQGRVTKRDLLDYIEQRSDSAQKKTLPAIAPSSTKTPTFSTEGNTEIIEMDRMRRLIADHMVRSKQVSPHVSSFVEADVTNLVQWRNKIKQAYQQKHGQKITFTPLFVEAVVRALQDFPMVNVSVDGTKIIKKKDIHIGMATALPNGNLIVPVIKHADRLNLIGLTQQVNELVSKARSGQLAPDDIQGGTFTLTNVGTFGNLMGTPIINQPQVAILATGVIRKKPVVIETEMGDVIAIRQMMYLSMSYDHRVVDGFLGGSFLKRVADYLEDVDPQRSIG